ncbi:MAG: peptidoglycan-binding domain-containing protein [Candidatus Binatia bacterium]
MKNILIVLGISLVVTTIGCAPLSRQPTHREQTAAVGGLAGGAGGAIIGSFIGSAVTGGLFGIPLGAIAGYYVGDQMANDDRVAKARMEDRDAELAGLRRENERLRRDDRMARGAQRPEREQSQNMASSGQSAMVSEQNITSSQPDSSASQGSTNPEQGMARSQENQGMANSQWGMMNATQVRQVQKKLNDMGFHAGQVDGVWGPNTQAALRNFQQAKGLDATGRLNEQTMNALGIEENDKQDKQPSATDGRETTGTQQK